MSILGLICLGAAYFERKDVPRCLGMVALAMVFFAMDFMFIKAVVTSG